MFLKFLGNYWKTTAALLLALIMFVTVLIFPAAAVFIAGLTVFGFAPFAFLSGLTGIVAGLAAAGIAAGATLVAAGLFNLFTAISQLGDSLFGSAKTVNATVKDEASKNSYVVTVQLLDVIDDTIEKSKSCCESEVTPIEISHFSRLFGGIEKPKNDISEKPEDNDRPLVERAENIDCEPSAQNGNGGGQFDGIKAVKLKPVSGKKEREDLYTASLSN